MELCHIYLQVDIMLAKKTSERQRMRFKTLPVPGPGMGQVVQTTQVPAIAERSPFSISSSLISILSFNSTFPYAKHQNYTVGPAFIAMFSIFRYSSIKRNKFRAEGGASASPYPPTLAHTHG